VAWYQSKDMMHTKDNGKTYNRTNGLLYVVASLSGSKIVPATNVELKSKQIMHAINNEGINEEVIHVFASDYIGKNNEVYCEYSGAVNFNGNNNNLLFTSSRETDFRKATDKENKEFMKFSYKGCANNSGLQSDDAQDKCKEAELIAVSDINKNGKPEFWATEIYKWYTGISVWEHNGQKHSKILESCPDCN